MAESNYKQVIGQFLTREADVQTFVDQYFALWKSDPDHENNDNRFQRLVNRIFTSCDCYAAIPENSLEITEDELRQEVALLHYIWWD